MSKPPKHFCRDRLRHVNLALKEVNNLIDSYSEDDPIDFARLGLQRVKTELEMLRNDLSQRKSGAIDE